MAGPSRRSRIVTWVSGAAAIAMIGTIAVVAAGYDAREAPRAEPAVWAMRTSGQYARVNTLTAEIDTVRAVDDPSGVVQAGDAGIVLSHGNGRAWAIDPTQPQDLVEAPDAGSTKDADADADAEAQDSATDLTRETARPAAHQPNDTSNDPTDEGATAQGAQAERMPDGARDVIAAGEHLLVRAESGDVYVGTLRNEAGDTGTHLALIDPFTGDTEPGETARTFVADAAAIDAEGRVAVLSTAAHELRWYSIERGEFMGVEQLPETLTAEDLQLTIVDGSWAALNSAGLWRSGSQTAVPLTLEPGAKLQASSLKGATPGVLIADSAGLWQVQGEAPVRIAEATGVPAQPMFVEGVAYAAWLGSAGASLWRATANGDGRLLDLDLDTDVKLPGEPELVFRTNGTTAVLSEVKTGMLWTVPDGRLIPVEQWTLADPPKERDGTVVVADVTEQEPPVAIDDAFGVRAGEPAPLPVLLNDFDPNRKDVLTIVTEGLAGDLDAKFGAVSVMPDGQTLAFAPATSATGSATFSYRITDGVNTSEPAKVTLTVVAADVNSGPEWCPVEGCQRQWPTPELAPGGTLVLPVLEGWVDPEGDPIMLASATPVDVEAPVRALVTADGRLAVRHLDPNADGGEVTVRVRVADAHGETTKRDLVVQVRANAKTELSPIATTVELGQQITVRPLARVTGGSGSYLLADASVQSGAARVAKGAEGTVLVTADEAGQSLVTLTVRDSGTKQETTGVMRITAVPAHAQLGLPPLRAFVRPLADTTVDILDAVPGANSRALVVEDAQVVDGELRADVIEYARVRVSGSTPDGAPGRIGSVDVSVAEGADTSVGRLTVFQVPEQGDLGAIAVADNATVRAGAVIDIPVLDNDVSAPGQRLVLHPEIGGSGAKGELAFASGTTLRYLAPSKPGKYTLSYTTFGASSPEASDVGQVHVTVLPRDGNRDPVPSPLTVRLAPGDSGSVRVPLSGVDPDGDRVRLVSVDASNDAQLTATISLRSSSIRVEASSRAVAGVHAVNYTVRDEFGGVAQGLLRIIVTTEAGEKSAPITYSDYVRLVQGTKNQAVVLPLENDLDPAGGDLTVVEVVPNVPGGKNSEEYLALAARLDTSEMAKGRISILSDATPGTVSYRYTVRSSESLSTADGLIVVQVSARVGQQAPTVRDTVLSARDRAELESGGVDVVTDRVSWATGDPSTLKLSVWGSAAKRFTANGNHLSGKYRAEGDLVAFKLTGTDVTGVEATSFGFLVIPPLDELRLTLASTFGQLKVDENKSRDASLTDLIDLGTTDRAEFKVGRFTTQRGQASCEATSSKSLRYTAGKGEPWADNCLISVKLIEQNTWTELSVPVQIVPKEPVAELEPLTRTVAPGAKQTINLMDMVHWQGDRAGRANDLQFAVSGGGASFEVTPAGTELNVLARADALSGAEDALTVTVTGAGRSQATLTLRVGVAAKDTPRGATVQLSCTVGSSCQTQLIGASGEYDPFKGKPGGGLKLESVDGAACAAYGTLQVSGDAVSVSWPDGARGPGGKCTATFSVRDAQDRVGSGTIELDARGVPRAPVGVTPVDATGSSVKLSVALSSVTSHPATTGVELTTGSGGTVGSCVLDGGQATCTVSGLTPGERATYVARAVNEVGASEQSANGAETWAYQPPKPPTIAAEPVHWADNTESKQGRVKVSIGQSTAATAVLSVDGTETTAPADGVFTLSNESHVFSVLSADSADQIPPGYSGGDDGRGNTNTVTVTPIGAPIAGSASMELSAPNLTKWTITHGAWNRNGGDELTYRYGFSPEGATAECNSTTSTGQAPRFKYISGSVCASNAYGMTETVQVGPVYTGGEVPAPKAGVTYTINYAWNQGDANTFSYGGIAPDASAFAPLVGELVWTIAVDAVSAPGYNASVKQCVSNGDCSDPVNVGPPAGKTPFTVSKSVASCIDPASDPSTWANYFTIVGNPGAAPGFSISGARNMLLSWPDNAYQEITFVDAMCEPPDPDPDPDPGDTGP